MGSVKATTILTNTESVSTNEKKSTVMSEDKRKAVFKLTLQLLRNYLNELVAV